MLRKKKGPGFFLEMDQASGKAVSPTAAGKSDPTEAKEAELLQAFYAIPSIDKAWTSTSRKGNRLSTCLFETPSYRIMHETGIHILSKVVSLTCANT